MFSTKLCAELLTFKRIRTKRSRTRCTTNGYESGPFIAGVFRVPYFMLVILPTFEQISTLFTGMARLRGKFCDGVDEIRFH